MKIKWDDGEQVTWRRDSLAGRPVEILDAGDDGQPAAPPEVSVLQQPATSGLPGAEVETTTPEAAVTATAAPAPEPFPAEPASPVPEPLAAQTGPAPSGESAAASAKTKRRQKVPTAPREKKVSALDAAVKVLGEAGRALTCQEMIETMAAKGYWTSPGDNTPAATLYSAILREAAIKGASARFVKTARGKFARNDAV